MRLCVVTTMRNEGPFLLEWVAWLRFVGVDDLLVYSNDCDDGTDALLDALARAGVLEHVRQSPPPEGQSVQWQALKAAWDHPVRARADWAMVLDCDEFPRPLASPTLKSVLADVAADAIAIPWRLFGHSGHVRADHGPVTQSFLHAAPRALSYPAAGRFIKSAFKLSGPFNGFGVHRPKQKRGATPVWVGPDGSPLPDAFARDAGRINLWGHTEGDALVQLNHYSLRSAESFVIKRDRGLPNRRTKDVGLSYWVERNFNTERETGMCAHAADLAQQMTELRALEGVEALEVQAREWHKARFNVLMQEPETVQLFGRLVLSTGSVPPPPDLARALVRAYGQSVTASKDTAADD